MRADDVYDADEGPAGASSSSAADKEPEAIYTCKFPGCDRQYASTDGVRKHCRKSHPDWLREVDLEKAALGCRWAAYCTRAVIEEGGEDPRTTPVGSKRAREIMAAGNAAYNGTFNTAHLTKASSVVERTASHSSEGTAKDAKEITREMTKEKAKEAFGDRGTLVPPKAHRAPSSENVVPPDIAVTKDLNSPLPLDSTLTPNAQARQRLGEIADHEGCPAVLQGTVGFFAWGMPPLKRGLSLSDTRESTITASGGSIMLPEPRDDESQGPPSRQEAFLDSIIA